MPRLNIAPLARERMQGYVSGQNEKLEGSGAELAQKFEEAFTLLQKYPLSGTKYKKSSVIRTIFVDF